MTKEHIEPLQTYPIKDKYGNVYGHTVPTNAELMDKVNEIIEYLSNHISVED